MLTTTMKPPHLHWSTADVMPQQAVGYWESTVCGSFVEIDVERGLRNSFRADLLEYALGPAAVQIIEAPAQSIRRTPARIARSSYDGYILLGLRAGHVRFEQFGVQSDLAAGDTVLVSCNHRYRVDYLSSIRGVGLRFPGEWLRNWLPEPQRVAAQPIRPRGGWSTALCAALASFDEPGSAPLALPEGVVAEQMAALLALAAGPAARSSSGTDKLLDRIRGSLRDRCLEPGIDPGAVAEGLGISKRYLHHLFAQAGTTFGAELMRMRLECAQRLLSDQRYAALSVSEIAARAGFHQPSHFARRFRQAFGAGPTAFRAARLAR